MFSVALILFREILEVALVVTVLLAATRQVPGRTRWVWTGIGAGAVGSLALAVGTQRLSDAMEGMGQEFFNGMVLLAASLMIAWTVIWMRAHGARLAADYKRSAADVAESRKPLYTLAVVTGLASLREGSEAVLFTYGTVAAGTPLLSVSAGAVLGIAAGALVGAGLYYGFVRVSHRSLFGVTSWLLILLACGMASQSAATFAAGGFIPELGGPVWDTSAWMSDSSLAGQMLHGLVGYASQPTGIQVLTYALTFVALMLLMRWAERRSSAFARKIGPARTSAHKVSVAAVLCAAACLTWGTAPASATQRVYSPHVSQGELELEYLGRVDFDDDPDKDRAQKQKFAVGYGVTDRWFTEIYGEIEREGGAEGDEDGFEFTAVEFENRLELTEPGETWVDVGLYFAYEIATKDDGHDKVEGKLLLEKETGVLSHRLNLILEREVGNGASNDTEGGLAWSTRWRAHEAVEPAVEWFSDFGALGSGTSWDEQKHSVGPALYGKISPHIGYEVAYLFGVSDAAPDGEIKWVLEFEWLI